MTKESILAELNQQLSQRNLPEIEKIRVTAGDRKSECQFTVWVKGVANNFSGIFHLTARESDVLLSSCDSSWLRKSIRESLEILCGLLNDLHFRSELFHWEKIPEK